MISELYIFCQDDNENHVQDVNDASERLTSDTSMDQQMTTTVSDATTTVRFEEMLIDVINATTLHVDWCPAINCSSIHGYKIRYSVKENCSYNEIFVTPGISNFTISGLKPNTEYAISVNAIDENEVIIQNCGWGTQKTEECEVINPLRRRFLLRRILHKGGICANCSVPEFSRSTPYVAVIVAAVLLTTAIVVPLTILFTAYVHPKNYETPYITAVAAILLLFIAVVVPITFLFVRKCSPCQSSTEQTLSVLQKETTSPKHYTMPSRTPHDRKANMAHRKGRRHKDRRALASHVNIKSTHSDLKRP